MNKKLLKSKLKGIDKWVILLVGTPLVGKSTFLREDFNDLDYTILSRDNTLLKIAKTDNYTEAWKSVNQGAVDKMLKLEFKTASEEGKNCVIDMTNLGKKRRKTNLSYFDDSYYKVAVVFESLSDKEYKIRNEKRLNEENKFIPYGVIKTMKKSYVTVTKDEGFNLIVY